MNTLLSHFLPNAIVEHQIHTYPKFFISHLKLRPFRSGLVAMFQDLSLIDSNTIQCKIAKLFYGISLQAIQVQYSIPHTITIQSARVSIGGTIVELNHITIDISDSITITIGDVRIPSILSIQRFDTPMNLTIRIHKGVISVNIPEVRIFSHPSLQQLQRIQTTIQRILPPEDPNAPPPKLHISSIFLRHMGTGWTRCISPISIGFSHQSVWEITEHIIRALVRI
jgi:hypothetical protein